MPLLSPVGSVTRRAHISITSAAHASQAHTPGIAKIKNVVKHVQDEEASTGSSSKSAKKRELDLTSFPPERIRNISIIAHIDHGKSTLADRLLEMTGTIIPGDNKQVLDKLTVEKERGITVKAQTVSMFYTSPRDGERYLINLIDTPGHVDFSYEVSRSLSACDGCLLLVDASQGIQAQTLSVFFAAAEQDLRIIPVLNKVDLPHAEPEVVSETIANELGIPQDEHLRISAKSGLGVERVLEAIVHDLPATIDWRERARRLGPGPELGETSTSRALVFDTYYDRFRGVVCYIRVFSGQLCRGDKLFTLASGAKYEVQEVGIFHPEETPVTSLRQGQVGYVVCNIKNPNETYVGDTLSSDALAVPLPGFKPLQSNIYAGVFPLDATELPNLEESIARLTLNDRSVTVQKESSTALGQGFRLGFLGTLHMDVWRQRLSDEYQADVIITAPSVRYLVTRDGGDEEAISKPAEFPEGKMVVREPMVRATIVLPSSESSAERSQSCAEQPLQDLSAPSWRCAATSIAVNNFYTNRAIHPIERRSSTNSRSRISRPISSAILKAGAADTLASITTLRVTRKVIS